MPVARCDTVCTALRLWDLVATIVLLLVGQLSSEQTRAICSLSCELVYIYDVPVPCTNELATTKLDAADVHVECKHLGAGSHKLS